MQEIVRLITQHGLALVFANVLLEQIGLSVIELDYTKVRPLHGGLDAWLAAGYEVEHRVAYRDRKRPP